MSSQPTQVEPVIAEKTGKIIHDFCAAMVGRDCSQWEVGVSTSDRDWFDDQMTNQKVNTFICRRAASAFDAYAIAKAFWSVGCAKSPHNMVHPNENALFVFASLKRTESQIIDE